MLLMKDDLIFPGGEVDVNLVAAVARNAVDLDQRAGGDNRRDRRIGGVFEGLRPLR